MIDTTYRFPQFGIGTSVGDGEQQHPTETDRVGRRCMLLDYPIDNDDVLDRTLGKFVHYLEERSIGNYWRTKRNA